jgi:hypothetical protein
MTKIVLDQGTRARFHGLKEPLQFVDESGHLLGMFTPSIDPARLQPQISDDEIQRRLAQGGGRPLADILHDLETRS